MHTLHLIYVAVISRMHYIIVNCTHENLMSEMRLVKREREREITTRYEAIFTHTQMALQCELK